MRDGTDHLTGVEILAFSDGVKLAAAFSPDGAKGMHVQGTDSNDLLTGGLGNDTLEGLGWSDVLDGKEGNDLLLGGADQDSLYAGIGQDTLDGGAGTDIAYFSGSFADYAASWDSTMREFKVLDLRPGGEGVDVVRQVELFSFADGQRTIADLVPGSGAGDALTGTAGDDVLGDTMGNDTLLGLEGMDSLWAGGGDDLLDGGAGDDQMAGGTGNDRLVGGAGTDIAWFAGSLADYDINSTALREIMLADRVAGRDGTDLASEVEYFGFQDGTWTAEQLLPLRPVGGLPPIDPALL
jgi:Ca2+-binding RTX toxin-like protein